MFFLFLFSHFYSKNLQRVGLLLSSRKRFLHKVNTHLSYPPNVNLYENSYHAASKYKLRSGIKDLKEYAAYVSYSELISLHKYYNTILNFPNAICIYHEILRRNSKVFSIFFPFGLRRFIAAHIMLGGIGISTFLNSNYSKKLIMILCFFSEFDGSSKYSKYIKGKSISLCGGGPSPCDNFDNIVSNDLVIKLNREEISDQRVEVVYFRTEKLKHLDKNGRLFNFSKMNCWLSIKSFRHYVKLRYFARLKNITPTVSLNSAFDCGKLNAIPTAALDLISRSSGIIYVFDTDLNLSKRHKDGYRGNDLPDVNFQLIFGEHPSYTQYAVLRYLYMKGYVKFEENPNFDIEWNYSKFIRKFSKVYI